MMKNEKSENKKFIKSKSLIFYLKIFSINLTFMEKLSVNLKMQKLPLQLMQSALDYNFQISSL